MIGMPNTHIGHPPSTSMFVSTNVIIWSGQNEEHDSPGPGYLTVHDPHMTRGVMHSEVSWLQTGSTFSMFTLYFSMYTRVLLSHHNVHMYW